MTDVQIDEAINAEVHEAIDFVWNDKWKHWERKSTSGARTVAKRIWNYTSDLNLMHEVIKTLNAEQFKNYVFELMDIIHEPLLASARQHAEAYLKAIGKWKWE